MKITEAIISQAILDLSPRMVGSPRCDPKCFELAKYFYPNEGGKFQTELAESIQELIEDMNPDKEVEEEDF